MITNKIAGSTFGEMQVQQIGEICFVYLDDIIVFSKELEEHE